MRRRGLRGGDERDCQKEPVLGVKYHVRIVWDWQVYNERRYQRTEMSKKSKKMSWIPGKWLFYGVCVALAGLIVFLFLSLYGLREYKNEVLLDGVKYRFNIYDVADEKIQFSRSERNPEIFGKNKWLPAATIALGGRFIESWDNDKLKSFFEK